MYAYLQPAWLQARSKPLYVAHHAEGPREADCKEKAPNLVGRTIKQYIGGKQWRPDSGYSIPVCDPDGNFIGNAPLGNRKDIRNAVEAAHKAESWAKTSAHTRAQILYYIAENLFQRRDEIATGLARMVGNDQASAEVNHGIERIFTYAAWADKYDGAVHNPPMRNVTLAMNEAIGVVGIICPPETPLLGFLSLVVPAIAAGNTVVAIPSDSYATIMGDLYQLLDTSDLPGGVVNIVAGPPLELAKTLAEHDDIDAIWCFRNREYATLVNAASIGNLKQVWTSNNLNWFDAKQCSGSYFMRHATQVKNIWVPYGE